MINRKIITVFLLLLGSICRGQYIFTSLQKKDGLNGNDVLCSYKDSEGFMWFGTARGLNRFDGSGFKVYNRENKRFPQLEDSRITDIVEYQKDRLIIATAKGLFCYLKQKNIFLSIPFIRGADTIHHLPVEKLFFDEQGRLWISTWKGLFVYKEAIAIPASNIFPSVAELDDRVLAAGGTCIDNTRKGIWLGTGKGLYFLDFKNGALYSAKHNPVNWAILDSASIKAVAVDRKGDLWLCSSTHLFTCWHAATNTIEDIQYINNDHALDLRAGCYRLYVDSRDRLWIGSWLGKIFVKDNNTDTLVVLPDASPAPYKLPVGAFYNIYEDDLHDLWIGTANGVSRLASTGFLKDIVELPSNLFNPKVGVAMINTITTAGKDSLWICKDDGLYLFSLISNKAKHFSVRSATSKPNRFFDAQLINGEYWCGTGNGIQLLDLHTGNFHAFQYYPKDYQLNNHSAIWIRQDRHQMVWYAIWGDGVFRFDPVKKQSERIMDLTDTPDGFFTSVNSLCFLEDKSGKIWLGYGEKGVRIYDYSNGRLTKPGTTEAAQHKIDQLIARDILQDKEGNIWLGTATRGILKLDASGNLLDSITLENGLGTSTITALQLDPSGRLWATTTESLDYINLQTKVAARLDLNMGMPAPDPIGAMLISGNMLYSSINNKIAKVDLLQAGKFTSAKPPLISGISVFEKEVGLPAVDPELKLNYDQNFFVIEFSSPNHHDLSSLQYAYQLKGFDKDWVYCGRRQTAAYTNVPNGHYTFLVKCTDAEGHWIEKATTIKIVIGPPFWKTWWFISSILLLLAFAGWRAYRFYIRRRQKKYIDTTIDYFANSVYGQNSVNEICWDIARNCIAQMHFEDCVVYLFDEGKNKLVQKAAYGPKNPKGHEIINPIEIEPGSGIVGTVAQTGKPLLINDTTKDERYIVDDERRYSELAVPIFHDNSVIGVIDSEHRSKDFFTEEHLKALSTIASISANKIAEAIAEAQAKANEIKVLEVNKMLAESQLMALRAQMNPHFVFNCLNSIQECIVTEKYGEASKYLNKFSKLFRMVLNNSGKKMVSLEEEKEVLQLYLELEQMRFEKSFEYTISVDEDLDADDIQIPSMLIQPYVENALWHGLMHKDGERKLSVSFTRINEDIFECVIEDNGIGRRRSFELKAEQSKSKRHESKGLSISKDRLDVLQKQGYHAMLQIIDKQDEHGNATGTKIVIELSTELNN